MFLNMQDTAGASQTLCDPELNWSGDIINNENVSVATEKCYDLSNMLSVLLPILHT